MAIDYDAILEHFGGEPDILHAAIESFLAERDGLIAAVEAAVRAGEAVRIGSAAHALKGCLGLFGEGEAYQTSRALEMLGKRGADPAGAQRLLAELKAQLETLCEELAAIRDRMPA